MPVTRSEVEARLAQLELPDGGNLVSRDMVRALTIEGADVRFVIEAPSPEMARMMEPLRAAAERAALSLPGVSKATVALTAHAAPPALKLGQHPKGGTSSIRPAGVASILAVASGKGGVGKSTVASNLAVALARAGRRVGLLDADIHGPSQPRMMGVSARPTSPDGQRITPLAAHGVVLMSIGLMLDPAKSVIWRGPMLMGALQQMLTQVDWGALDVLIVDLPPGTGDVQLTLSQRARPDGAIIVSTPQDVALLDARKAMDMFTTLDVPMLGMIENMSYFQCPDCGHEAHIFGHGGVRAEAEKLGLALLAALPIDLETRLAGDAGRPVAAGEGAVAQAYAGLAARLVRDGYA
ncbi:ATP-binding protein involved in chromosome partitioning [Roseovarius azorensis]|uniref:Iron-sulfur cluster carrier protein n=1 Tax=Roseovarius azorensis TaxID=1287727 RepID=A0A1H7MDB0_9RHOB|nr:Mrp/NBP35 family ATP-binding protein [Roseovarius azorensis]SEL08898.1 ATP-binding protein involved in chromosome partitioning [Roseovarius azorensis]